MHNEAEQQAKFKISLHEFQLQKNLKKTKQQEGKYHDFKLYKLICRHGGCQAVTNRRQWATIAQQLEAKDYTKLKTYYIKFIYPYEQKYYFGKEEEQQLPNMIGGMPKKMVKTDNTKDKPKVEQNSTFEVELARHFEQQEKNKRHFFLKKKKLTHTKAQTKKIILGLQSFMDKTQIIYSLNMLLLYSVNVQQPFLFQHHQKIFTALSSYLHSIYPPKDNQQLQHLRMITLIIRNLTLYPKNLKYMLGTNLFNLLVTIFNTGLDSQQCSKNIVDIMSGLVKVGWDVNQIIKELNNAILDDKIEDVQLGLQLLRGLVDEREDALVDVITENLPVFVRVLLSIDVSIEMKQQVMEIMAFVTDVGVDTRINFAKNSLFIGILVGILQHMRNQQKLTQFTALTINNISNTTGSRAYLKPFETELMTIGFTDDSLAGIMANILADIANS